MSSSDKTIKNTLSKIKEFTQEYEREQEKLANVISKAEEITDSLVSSLNLINPDPKEKIAHLEQEIQNWIDNSQIEMFAIENSITQLTNSSNTDQIRKQQFKEKIHYFRASDLSVLFQRDPNLKSIYYICSTLLIWFSVWVVVNHFQRTGHTIDFDFWNSAWEGVPFFFKLHLCLLLYTHAIVIFVQFIKVISERKGRINYYLLFTGYTLIQLVIPSVVFWRFRNTKRGLAAGTAMGAETVRIMMKIHSYFREKILYGLKQYHMEYASFSPNVKQNSAELLDITIENYVTEVKRFYYYMFCPSLIYRDSYPRLPKFRFGACISQFFNLLACISFFYVFVVYVIKPYLSQDYIISYYSVSSFIDDCLHLSAPASLSIMIFFFLILHSWMNFWSELLCHGDRRFYEDWWNCTNFEQYYRKWNMIVHEWLYYYIYNDVKRFSLGKSSRSLSRFLVFSISVIIHEILISMSINGFFPVLSFFFGGPGVIFTYIKTTKKQYNIIFWLELLIGPGIILALYVREFNLRLAFENITYNSHWHSFVPKLALMYIEPYKTRLLTLLNAKK